MSYYKIENKIYILTSTNYYMLIDMDDEEGLYGCVFGKGKKSKFVDENLVYKKQLADFTEPERIRIKEMKESRE